MSQMIGVDVGLKSIKVVYLDKNQDKYSLLGIGEVASPNMEWVNGDTSAKNLDEVAKAIKNLLKDLKINTKKVATALPEHETISRLVQLPPLKENEIKDALRFEAETFVPYPLEKVSIDYEIINEDEAGRLSVLAIAAKNDLIANYVKIFKESGLELTAIESPAISGKRLLGQMGVSMESTISVDIGEKFSNIVAFKKGNIYFSRSMPVGGESLTRAISVNLGLDMASAEEYKKAYGIREMELEGKIKNAIMPVFNSMAEEIRKAMVMFSEDGEKHINLLILSGGGSKMPGIAEELARILGVEVQVIQPFLKVDSSKIVSPIDLTSDGYRFSTAVGLAMREAL
ncbi:type IV pilus assembly protein PilM [Candidatus Shapirobacteria bacterium]|nr:type IV pilus assembly protein PilM [Candidatus Shapirobacteria bacterium]HQI13438.1 type IV pilus assembly protein PilM [Candidatus Woesebacteria bacterium]